MPQGGFLGGRGARGAPWAQPKAAPGRGRLRADGGRFAQKWGALSSGARPARTCSGCHLLPNVHSPAPPLQRRPPRPPGSGREAAGLGGATADGGRPTVGPSVRRGAGDTPAASAPRALVAGSVGRAAPGFRGPGRPLSGRKTHGKPPSPRARRGLRTSAGGAPVRRACRRPRPERRPAPSRRRPGPHAPGRRGPPTLPGLGDGRPGTRGAAVAGPRRGRQRPSPGECGGPRPVAPLRVCAAPPRSPAPRPRRSWAAPAGPPSWRPSGSRSSP